jgi:hypothetical protein
MTITMAGFMGLGAKIAGENKPKGKKENEPEKNLEENMEETPKSISI